jgi:hypothetical protein
MLVGAFTMLENVKGINKEGTGLHRVGRWLAVDRAGAGFYSNLVFWPSNASGFCCCICLPPCG